LYGPKATQNPGVILDGNAEENTSFTTREDHLS
jgi:hypothetical protein